MKRLYLALTILLILAGCSTQTPKSDLIVLYYGIPIGTTYEGVDTTGLNAEQIQQLKEKYNISYYLYNDGEFSAAAVGDLQEYTYENHWIVRFGNIDEPEEYKHQIAISQDYNPYPRTPVITADGFAQEFLSGSAISNQITAKFEVYAKITELCTIDLEGNGTNEYIALFVDEDNNFFARCLINSSYEIVSYLTCFQDPFDNPAVLESDRLIYSYNLDKYHEIADINNDGLMEILTYIPQYEGSMFKISAYDNGEFDGDFITWCSLVP